MQDSEGIVAGRSLWVVANGLPDGARTQAHRHQRGHLVYAATGAYVVETEVGTWIAPPQRALWVPPAMPHHARASGSVDLYTVYVDPPAATCLPDSCSPVTVGELLRALILEAAKLPRDGPPTTREKRIVALLLDEIRPVASAHFHLPLPVDKRAAELCRMLRADPAAGCTLAQWGERVGASERTLARTFKHEIGMTFGQWRQEARLLASVEYLASGDSVARVAARVGYISPSAFSQMFRHALGMSPRHCGTDAPRVPTDGS